MNKTFKLKHIQAAYDHTGKKTDTKTAYEIICTDTKVLSRILEVSWFYVIEDHND